MSTTYIIDTNEWINLKTYYPRRIFPNLWKHIEKLITDVRILEPRAVLDEIKRGDDELVEWCKRYPQMFQNTDNITSQVQNIIHEHPSLINPHKPYEDADPYIIAFAQSRQDAHGRTAVIVTAEHASKQSRIPHVARTYDLETCTLLEMFQKERWEF